MSEHEPPWRRYAAQLPSAIKGEVVDKLKETDAARAPLEKKKATKHYRKVGADDATALLADRYSSARMREPVKPTRRQRRAAFATRGRQMLRAMEAHLGKYKQRLRELGQHDADPVGIQPHVHRMGQLISSDPSGRACLIALCQMPRGIAMATLKSALRIEPIEGQAGPPRGAPSAKRYWLGPGRRSLQHPAVIRQIAVVVVLWLQGKRTRRAGFERVVHGVPRPLLCKLLADQHGYAPSTGAVFGKSRRGMLGPVPLLKQSGVLSVQQPPGDAVEACDRGPSGYAFNVYWFPRASRGWPEVEQGLEQDLLALHVAAARRRAAGGEPLELVPAAPD